MRVESFCDTGLSFPLQRSDFPLHQETNCSQLNIGLDDPIYEQWVQRKMQARMVLRRLYPGRARMRMVQAIKRHKACKRARMLKRSASDVTEPASPDGVQRANLFFRRIEAIREEYRQKMEEIELRRLSMMGLLDGPPATFESMVVDNVNIDLDDPIFVQ